MTDALVLSLCGLAAGLVVALVDGHRAVPLAATAAGVGLLPTMSAVGGEPATLLMFLAVTGTVVTVLAAEALAVRWPWVAGLDPDVSLFSPPDALFGPRSARLLAAVLSLPVASWVSFNIPIGGIVGVEGLLFASAYVWCCGVVRLVVARTVEDLSVGVVAVALAGASAWLVRGGPGAIDEAAVLVALGPVIGATVGWLSGRHHRRRSALPSS